MDHTADTQTGRLYFGLTQAVGDHEPQYPGLSRMPHSSVTADNRLLLSQYRTAASVPQTHRGWATLMTGKEVIQ